MNKKITINSKEYEVPTFNYGTICDLEDLGISLTDDLQNKAFSFVRGLVALTIGCDLNKASNEINEHIENGGSLDDFTILVNELTNSGFFQKMVKKQK